MKKFYYDVAGAANRGALVSLLEMVAATQVLFGTDYPSGLPNDIIAGLATIGFQRSRSRRQSIAAMRLRLLPRLREMSF